MSIDISITVVVLVSITHELDYRDIANILLPLSQMT